MFHLHFDLRRLSLVSCYLRHVQTVRNEKLVHSHISGLSVGGPVSDLCRKVFPEITRSWDDSVRVVFLQSEGCRYDSSSHMSRINVPLAHRHVGKAY